jgi:hypothetical protein
VDAVEFFSRRDESYLLEKETSMLRPLADIVFELFNEDDEDDFNLDESPRRKSNKSVAFAPKLEVGPTKYRTTEGKVANGKSQPQRNDPMTSIEEVYQVIDLLSNSNLL